MFSESQIRDAAFALVNHDRFAIAKLPPLMSWEQLNESEKAVYTAKAKAVIDSLTVHA